VLPDDDMRRVIETCRSSESVNYFRLIYDIQLVHLLVCNTQWIFKMHSATIKMIGSNIYNTNTKFASPFNSSFYSWNGTILDNTETRTNEYISNTFTKTNTWTFSLKQFHPLLRNVMEICEMLQWITTKLMLSQTGEKTFLSHRWSTSFAEFKGW
jgi:hypothetical protein